MALGICRLDIGYGRRYACGAGNRLRRGRACASPSPDGPQIELRRELATRSRKSTRVKMIKKVKAGYKVVSSKGKNLGGPYKTMEEAKKRLRQVEFFKRAK